MKNSSLRLARGDFSFVSLFNNGWKNFLGRVCGYVAVIHGDGASVAGEEEKDGISTFCVYYNDMMRKNGIWDILEENICGFWNN